VPGRRTPLDADPSDGKARSSVTLSELGDLGDFLGGVGVIVTLAYLAIQIRRNTQEVRSASLDAVAASHMEFQRSVWGDPVLTKLWFDGMSGRVALPADEGRRFLFMVITCARHWERAYHKARGGTLESTSWSGIHQELAGVFAFPGTHEYWKRIQYMFPSDFVDFAEKAIRGIKDAERAA
jgi:hypothetical protein